MTQPRRPGGKRPRGVVRRAGSTSNTINRGASRGRPPGPPGSRPQRPPVRRSWSGSQLVAIGGVIALLIVVAVAVGGGLVRIGGPAASGGAPARSGCPAAAPTSLPVGETRTVTIQTTKGAIVIKVESALAPEATGNFVALASCGFYDGVVFHRVVPGFVVQGGDGQYGRLASLDRAKVGKGGPGYSFADEPVNGDYTRGTVAMANSGPNTNGSQFFICTADLSGSLPKSYTIFGHVTSGMDVVDEIVGAPRDTNDLPNDPVAMTSLTVASP